MADHLPECPFDAALAKYADRTERQQKIVADLLVKFDVCICAELRTYGKRIRDAVAARGHHDWCEIYEPTFCTCGLLGDLTAIDALRG